MALQNGPLTGAPINIPGLLGLPNVPFQSAYDDTTGSPGPPNIVYKVEAGANATIAILGSSFVGPFTFSFVDINVTGNGDPPTVASVSSTDTQIDLELSLGDVDPGDVWGILLQDGNGDAYALPSPLRIVSTPP